MAVQLPPELKILLEKFVGDLATPDSHLLPVIFLILARTIPFFYMSFFMASRLIPMPLKVMFSLALFFYMIPSVLTSARDLDFSWNWAGYIIKEIFLGIILGMLASIPSYIVMISGMLIDFQRGASSLVTTNVILAVQDSPLGILFTYLMIYIYWKQDIPFLYLDAIAQSYLVFPLDRFIPENVFSFDGILYKQLRELFSVLYATGIQLAAPSLVILLMIDMFLGITNRLAPQVMISFLAQGLKAMLGIVVLVMGWGYIMTIFSGQALRWAEQFHTWIIQMPF